MAHAGQAAEHRREVSQLLAKGEPNDALYWKSYMCASHRSYIKDCLADLRRALRILAAERKRLDAA